MGKNAFCPSGEISKECSEGSRDVAEDKEFVDPQCEPSANSVDPMVEGPALCRARRTVDKGKGLASGVQLFKGICKKPRKKRSTLQEMFDFLKSISDVIVESRSVSTHTSFRTTAAIKMQAIMDMVLSLPRVQAANRLHMFSTFFFENNVDGRNMFAANVQRKEVQLRWLEKQYEMNLSFMFFEGKGLVYSPGCLSLCTSWCCSNRISFMYLLHPFFFFLFFFCIGTNYMLAMGVYIKQWLLINCHLLYAYLFLFLMLVFIIVICK